MKTIIYFFFASFLFSFLISCNEKRNNKLLVLYQEDGQNFDLKIECIQILQASSFDFDIIDSESQRLGDSLWKNSALIILADPQSTMAIRHRTVCSNGRNTFDAN